MNKVICCLIVGCLLHCNPALHAQNKLPGLKNWFVSEQLNTGSIAMRDRMVQNAMPLSPDHPASTFASFLNYNPAVFYTENSGGLSVPLGNTALNNTTIFIVATATDTFNEKCLWALENNGKSRLLMTTKRVADLDHFRYLNFMEKNDARSGIRTFYRNGEKESGTTDIQLLRIGAKPPESTLPVSAFNGQIAEVLIFERVLSAKERKQIESYLAIKYGISLLENYYNSRGEIIWNTALHADFSQNITGIGRDNSYQLDQKQSCGRNPKPLLEIGAGNIAVTNAQNTSALNDNSFLLWGDNGQLPFFDLSLNDTLRVLATKWRMVSYGQNADLPTEMRFDPGRLAERRLPGESYVLLIDRSGTGLFKPGSMEVINPAPGAELVFRDIHWDTDASGNDAFTLAIATPAGGLMEGDELPADESNFESLSLWPNPSADGFFSVAIKLKQAATLTFRVVDTSGRAFQTGRLSGSDRYFFSKDLQMKGAFLLTFSDGAQTRSLHLLIP